VISRISRLENLVHSHYGELSSQVRTLTEAIDLGKMPSVEHERQLANKEVHQHSASQVLAEIQMQVNGLLQATRDAERRADAQEESLIARMEASSICIQALSRRVDELLLDTVNSNEIVASQPTVCVRNSEGGLSYDQDALQGTEVRLAHLEEEVGTLALQRREACCELEAFQEAFATMKIQMDRLEGDMNIGLLGRFSDHIVTLDSIVSRLEGGTTMGKLGALSDRINMVASKADQLKGQTSMGLLDRLCEHIKLTEVKMGSGISMKPRDVALSDFEAVMQLVGLLLEQLDRFESTASGARAAASQDGKKLVGSSESCDRPEAELGTFVTCLSERLTHQEWNVREVRDTCADETSLASKIPQVAQLFQHFLRLDKSISTLQQGLRETHLLCGGVHEIAKDSQERLSALSESVSRLDSDVGNLLRPPVLWQSELKKQYETKLENIRASCKEAREVAESFSAAFSSDLNMLVKTSTESQQDTKLLNSRTEKLEVKVEQIASRVDLFVSAEARGMQQGLQTLGKICDALKHESGEKRQLRSGETARANMLAAKVAGGGSGASTKLKPSGSCARQGSCPIRQLVEVKVETHSDTQPSGILTAPPSSRQPRPQQSLVPPLRQSHKWQFSSN